MKVSIVYWSGTGNTEAMANAALEGAKNAGAEVELLPVSAASAAASVVFPAAARPSMAMTPTPAGLSFS